MIQIRFGGSTAFTAMLNRPPSQFGVPELPGVVEDSVAEPDPGRSKDLDRVMSM